MDSKAAAKFAVLLAVAALFAAARADHHERDDRHWRCYSSCMHKCYHDDDAAVGSTDGGGAAAAAVSVRDDDDHGDYHKCKEECVEDCFEDVPAVCYHMCVADSCLSLPPYSAARVACFKRCGMKCFHHDSPKPGPKPKPKPGPPKPAPKPVPPKPSPKPMPPKPAPPKPGPPKPLPRPPCPPKAPVTSSNVNSSSSN